jgi:hypothetical protein
MQSFKMMRALWLVQSFELEVSKFWVEYEKGPTFCLFVQILSNTILPLLTSVPSSYLLYILKPGDLIIEEKQVIDRDMKMA